MNERIKELAEQAWNYVDSQNPCDGDEPYDSDEHEMFQEKFAELIVQECIGWCNAYARVDGTAQKIVESIKKDFGV